MESNFFSIKFWKNKIHYLRISYTHKSESEYKE